MKTDVVEHDKDYQVTAEMPGFKKDDIHVDYRDDTLRISGTSNVTNRPRTTRAASYGKNVLVKTFPGPSTCQTLT
jgi:Molecular chaperone (small heat shock protein)